jgi:filamentous hemagglutinin
MLPSKQLPGRRDLVIPVQNKDYKGQVDLGPTIDRIQKGTGSGAPKLSRNDGGIFQNKEKLIREQPAGYYRKFVVPTPGLNQPGALRLIVGKKGELYFTQNHYQQGSWRQIAGPNK